MNAPPKERMRMFAAGPATNLFAAFICLLLIGGLAGQFVASHENIHVRGIIQGQGADDAGIQPWDTLESIDGKEIEGLDGFYTIMEDYSANDTVTISVLHQDGTKENLNTTFSDKYDYYIDLGWSESNLENLNISKGDPFLGIEGIAEGTHGIDRIAGPFSPRWDGNLAQKALVLPFHTLGLMMNLND